MRSELTKVLDLAQSLDAAELAVLCGELTTIFIIAHGRLAARVGGSPPDRLIDIRELADRLHVSGDYIYRNKKKYAAFARPQGGKLLWSSSGLDAFLKKSR